MDTFLLGFVCLFGLGSVLSTSEPNAFAPEIISKFSNSRNIPLFHGKIREDETTVRLEPALKARDNDTVGLARLICRYKISTNRKNLPFVIELKNRQTGEAVIKVKEGEKLDFEKRRHYKFNVFAYDCVDPPYDHRSNRAVVTIEVEGVDKFAPVFEETVYNVDMEEDRLYENLLQVKATDKDTDSVNGEICSYELLSNDAPFVLDDKGVLKNTEKVSHKIHVNFILKIQARDCGGMASQPAHININVVEKCKSGWTDFPEHIEYTPGTGHQVLTESGHLRVCEEQCEPEHITVKLQLETKHIGKGCDRDTYSISSQRKLCGASDFSVDLLPAPTLTSNWTNSLPTDDGNDGDKIYAFDGITNAVVVPNEHVNHKLGKHFTISTWMKHTFPNTVVTDHKKGNKEHLLCMSDGDGMNRHHYALFVHNTKLVFVLRKESEESNDLEKFSPAEWRWDLDEVNDGLWHHYALSMDFPQVRLYVDGKMVEPSEDRFEVLDDWPLHPTDRVHFTKLVVGACWRGQEEHYSEHFQGFLAGLSLLKDKTESERVIHCLNTCQESLDFNGLDKMPSGTSVSFNTEMTEFSITGQRAEDLEDLVKQITYINYRNFPTPGRRNLHITTTVKCVDREEVLPGVESYVFVQHSNKPVITVTGNGMVTGNRQALEDGINVFKDIGIHVDFTIPSNEVDDDDDDDSSEDVDINDTSYVKQARLSYKLNKASLMQKSMLDSESRGDVLLDMCTVRAEPVLDFYVEHLELPKNVIQQFNMKLEGIETAAGLVILNADLIDNYLTVIRNIRYIHEDVVDMYSRKFILSCSSQSGRFVSNEFEITIAHGGEDEKEPVVVPVAHVQNDGLNLVQPQFNHHFNRSATTNFGMVAIIVVCVGFLLFMIVLGVFRIRAAHHRRPRNSHLDNGQEMEWDNSELNITVNPIDQELFEYEENPQKLRMPDDSDIDDDLSDCYVNDSSEEEEGETAVKTLEWDDSTLSY